jgi:hypothetical protein
MKLPCADVMPVVGCYSLVAAVGNSRDIVEGWNLGVKRVAAQTVRPIRPQGSASLAEPNPQPV